MLLRAALLLHLCTAADPYERGIAAARKADLARAKASFTAAGEKASALQALATLHLIDGDVAANPALFDRAVAEAATAAS